MYNIPLIRVIVHTLLLEKCKECRALSKLDNYWYHNQPKSLHDTFMLVVP